MTTFRMIMSYQALNLAIQIRLLGAFAPKTLLKYKEPMNK